MTTIDQTYLVILGAAAVQASHNARILAEHGNQQLGRPWSDHPGLRVWNGNLTRIGHSDPAAFVTEANSLLPSHMYVDHAHHWHVRLTDGTWERCTADADGAAPITTAITQTRDQDHEETSQ